MAFLAVLVLGGPSRENCNNRVLVSKLFVIGGDANYLVLKLFVETVLVSKIIHLFSVCTRFTTSGNQRFLHQKKKQKKLNAKKTYVMIKY